MASTRQMNPMEFAVCMGMDAMRLCLGKQPRNFTAKEVIRWIRAMSRSALLHALDNQNEAGRG